MIDLGIYKIFFTRLSPFLSVLLLSKCIEKRLKEQLALLRKWLLYHQKDEKKTILENLLIYINTLTQYYKFVTAETSFLRWTNELYSLKFA